VLADQIGAIGKLSAAETRAESRGPLSELFHRARSFRLVFQDGFDFPLE
jgi:hypothetical protein